MRAAVAHRTRRRRRSRSHLAAASSDLVTLAQHRLPVVIGVHHDGQIGMIHYMQAMVGRAPYATEVGEVDYVKMAEAAGLKGIRVDDPSHIGLAWDEALAEDGPILIEFMAGHDFPRPSAQRFKLGIVGGWTGSRPDAHLQAPSYVAAREQAAPFARRLGAEAARRGSLDVVDLRGRAADGGGHEAILRPVVVLGDGAKWIWEEVAASFGSERTEIVDWWHGAEHLWDLSKALHGESLSETAAWAAHAKHVLWRC